MDKIEKELLFKDLCARLPYGVICDRLGHTKKLLSVSPYKVYCLEFDNGEYMPGGYKIEDIRPYLRPLSSMTEEEKEELKEEHKKDERIYAEVIERIANGDEHARGTAIPHFAADWCNKNHFDYRGLIEKGLALEAPKRMYND